MYLSVLWIDAWKIDLRCEGYLGRNVRVACAAVDLDTVDTVLVDALQAISELSGIDSLRTHT